MNSRLKKVNDKADKNSSDILSDESKVKQKEDRIDDLEREASYFKGKDHYKDQSYLLFQPKSASFTRSGGNISNWKTAGVHNNNNINLSAVANSSGVVPELLNQNNRLGVTFAGNLLKQTRIAYIDGTIIHVYIVHKLRKRTNNNPDMSLENSLFGAVKITKNINTSEYNYSGYGISFDANGSFSHPKSNNLDAKNITFGCDLSTSAHLNNRNNHILVVVKDFIQVINGTTVYAEAMYQTDFTEKNKFFVLSLDYTNDDSYFFVMVYSNTKLKQHIVKLIEICYA